MNLRPVLAAVLLASLALPAAAHHPREAAERTARADRVEADENERPTCLRDTGSRIKPREGRCITAVGRSWSREDLERTGRMDVADALRMLDPAVY